jgi:hypothetical protein
MNLLDLYKSGVREMKSMLRHWQTFGPARNVKSTQSAVCRSRVIVRRNTPAHPGRRSNAIPKRHRPYYRWE